MMHSYVSVLRLMSLLLVGFVAVGASAQDYLPPAAAPPLPYPPPSAVGTGAVPPGPGLIGGVPLSSVPIPSVPPSAVLPAPETVDAAADALNITNTREASWYYPWTWVPLDGWTNSAELGINASSGNSNSFSFQTGARFKRKTDSNLFDTRISHNRTQANGVEKQNNALLYSDYDRFFGDSPWSGFLKQGLEYDRFKAFDVRYFITPGLAYRLIKTESLTLQGRLGSGVSREFGGPDDRWVPEALFGVNYEHQWNKRNKWVAKVDYFPEWGDFNSYRIISDASWEMLWDEVGNLSFKLGAVDRYDSTPNGRQANDLNYSMMLLYKF